MRNITAQQIVKDYAALVEIEQQIRKAGRTDADRIYSRYQGLFPAREDFNRIIRVLELSNQVAQRGNTLIWNRRRS